MYKDSDALVVTLKVHLEHAKDVLSGKTIGVIDHDKRLVIMLDELRMMLALIEGRKGV